MYRVHFTYCNSSLGNAYDDECDLDYRYYESQEVTYIYKHLDYDSLLDLLKKDVGDLSRVSKGSISIYLDYEE